MTTLLDRINALDEMDIPFDVAPVATVAEEPDVPIEDEDIPIEPEQAMTVSQALAPATLVDILPADFPLPILTQFVPDVRLREALVASVGYAAKVDVTGVEGLQRADVALAVVRKDLKAIHEHFAEPADIANKLHKRITSVRSEWCETGDATVKTLGNRMWAEQQRLSAIAAEERRKAQKSADREERERVHREAA